MIAEPVGPPSWLWRLLAALAVFVSIGTVATGALVGITAVDRQRDIKRNTELAVCLAALESRLHLGEIAMLQVDFGPDRDRIVQALNLNELAFRLQRLERYCPTG